MVSNILQQNYHGYINLAWRNRNMLVVGPRNGSPKSSVHTAVISLDARRSIRGMCFSVPFG